MRVLLNGRDIGGLDPHLQRRLWGRRSDRVVEGVTISAQESIAARARELQLLLGGTAAAVAALLALNLFIVVARAPQVLIYVIPALAAAALFIGGLVFFIYTMMLGDHRKRVEARASEALPGGTTVRLDGTGLSVGGLSWAWPSLKVDELGIRQRQGEHQRITYVERLVLSDGRRAIPLDALFLTNGRAVLEQAWLRTAEPPV
jgi:hypothetical protein